MHTHTLTHKEKTLNSPSAYKLIKDNEGDLARKLNSILIMLILSQPKQPKVNRVQVTLRYSSCISQNAKHTLTRETCTGHDNIIT